ncbi:hypothetical protein AGMMS50225_24250 [Betaproteobacteria bacterium]|nr:hypothetical protein AGMMS50225_24250 [Betaproteobacteria bacterium]
MKQRIKYKPRYNKNTKRKAQAGNIADDAILKKYLRYAEKYRLANIIYYPPKYCVCVCFCYVPEQADCDHYCKKTKRKRKY